MIYGVSLALLTDLYELTMAYGYWKLGMAEREAVFTLTYRRPPFKGSFAVAAGLETAIQFVENFRFQEDDLAYLEGLKTANGAPLFEKGFLDYLRGFSFQGDIFAMPEGTPAFPYEPLLVVRGPIIGAQLLESALLNIVNFQTIIATKASRIVAAAEGDPVVEFGLRRAQGMDGALSAARAAIVGGCAATSNTLAGKLYDVPVRGTQAHSWIMAFGSEKEAFEAYSNVLPHNCLYLVDTYNSLKGAENAVAVAKEKKIDMIGLRLDSGDLAELSIELRKILDKNEFSNAKIMASNELDEFIIRDLKKQGAKIDLWGVGTNLITAKDQPALDGVYKLAAIQDEKGKWVYKIKISEQLIKTTNPGMLQVRRFFDGEGKASSDMMYDMELGAEKTGVLTDPFDIARKRKIDNFQYTDLLVPIFERGKKVYSSPSLMDIQKKGKEDLEKLHSTVKRFLNPEPYFVGLDSKIYDLKMKLINELKNE